MAISIILITFTSLSFWIAGKTEAKSYFRMIYLRYLSIAMQQQYKKKYLLYPS